MRTLNDNSEGKIISSQKSLVHIEYDIRYVSQLNIKSFIKIVFCSDSLKKRNVSASSGIILKTTGAGTGSLNLQVMLLYRRSMLSLFNKYNTHKQISIKLVENNMNIFLYIRAQTMYRQM